MIECLGIHAFSDGLREHDTQRTLRLAHTKTLIDALTAALEYKAATKASGYNKFRSIQIKGNEDKI